MAAAVVMQLKFTDGIRDLLQTAASCSSDQVFLLIMIRSSQHDAQA